MATPTKTEIWDQTTKRARVYDQLFQYANAIYLVDEENADNALKGDHHSQLATASRNFRNTLSSSYSGGRSQILTLLQAILRYGYGVNLTNASEDEVFDRLSKEMDSAGETIASRDITFGTITAGGGNAGTGTILRNTVDKHGNNIESGIMGDVKLRTIQDVNTGAISGSEQVQIFGDGITKQDEIELGTSTAEKANINFFRADRALLKNPSFDQIPTTINQVNQPGWELSSASNFTKVTTPVADLFRYTSGTEHTTLPTGASLRFEDNGTITQYIAREQFNISQDLQRPYFLVLRYKRKNNVDGALTLRLGSKTVSIPDLTAVANDTWFSLVLGENTSDSYYENFFENFVDTNNVSLGTRIQVELSGRTTGELIVDEIIFARGILFNGLFYLPISGQNTTSPSGDTLIDDEWTFSDSFTGASAAGRTQEVLSRLFSKHLPHTTGAETFPDA